MRVQFELSEERVKELENLMEETKTKTKKDLLNNALSLLEWAIDERKVGRIIASVNEKENKYKEVIMPILSNVKSNWLSIQKIEIGSLNFLYREFWENIVTTWNYTF